jgi:hypothetical protein
MKKLLVLIASAVALFLVTLAPSSVSAGGVSIYVGPGYGYAYPPYGYGYYYPRYRYGYYPRYRRGPYPRGYFDYPRRRAWRGWY